MPPLLKNTLTWINPIGGIRRLALMLANWRRKRHKDLDYIVIDLPPTLPALPENRNWIMKRVMGAPPLSLHDLDRVFQRIAHDPRPKGIILQTNGLDMPLADIQTLRDSCLYLRESGKSIICYAHHYDTRTYLLASICDEIWLQPGGDMVTTGLVQEQLFLSDALDAVGLQMDPVAISPYKTALDSFAHNQPTPENSAQLNWLMDSFYETLVNDIAQGRKMTPEAVRRMIDGAPYTDEQALEAGYIDAIDNPEQFVMHHNIQHITTWDAAEKRLLIQQRKRHDKHVAVLGLSGMIVDGESRKPPIEPPIPLPFVGAENMGGKTVVRHVRQLMKDKNAAAVVLYVDSGGGSATASEAITSALLELAKDRPVVAVMGAVAGSGGYYICTPAHWIIAQPSTLTGSIGVIMGKLISGDLLNKLRFNAVPFHRGANADLMTSNTPFTDSQRTQVRMLIERIYQQFVAHVASSRKMKFDEVDAIGGGRVWTGVQALENGLVDQLGGLKEGLAKARELADLPDDAPAVLFQGENKPIGPQLAETLNPAASLDHWRRNVRSITSGKAQMLMPIRWETRE